jgi:hypothetical protein
MRRGVCYLQSGDIRFKDDDTKGKTGGRYPCYKNWSRSWEHSKVEELTEIIVEALDKLEGE